MSAPSSAAPLLRVQGVSVRFGGLRALDDVSFEVRRGEILALIGPNGAGKSTLLNVVSGAARPDAGEVWLEGRRVDGSGPDAVNRLGLARTFQSAETVAGLSVCENVMAAGSAHRRNGFVGALLGRAGPAARALREQALELLTLVGLEALADQSAALLTAGQQRLLASARALATGAKLLILDEPAAGLNTVEKHALAEVVLRIRARGVTVLFVEHDLGFVGRLAERMVVLDHGKVIAEGLPQDVQQAPAVLEAYLGGTEIAAREGGRSAPCSGPALLSLEHASVRYGSLTALDDVDLELRPGEIVALVGANGAGKSSLLKAIAGAVPLAGGTLRLEGQDLRATAMEARRALGIGLSPEGRALFAALSVRDNLLVGRYAQLRAAGLQQLLRPSGAALQAMERTLEEVLAFFPRLRERIDQQAGTLSGGEAQMLAIGRALMGEPRLLLLDEPSFGLAPQVSREILSSLPRLAARGMAVLMVEQNARAALQVADRAYILVNGRVVAHGRSEVLSADASIAKAYLGWDTAEAAHTEQEAA